MGTVDGASAASERLSVFCTIATRNDLKSQGFATFVYREHRVFASPNLINCASLLVTEGRTWSNLRPLKEVGCLNSFWIREIAKIESRMIAFARVSTYSQRSFYDDHQVA